MSKTFLLLGGNLGDREENLRNAVFKIANRIGEVLEMSSIYETAAWGVEDQPDFLNQVLLVDTILSPEELLFTCLEIEKDLGRVRKEHWGERIIDIDILFIEDKIINTQRLTVPHPEVQNRRFTLEPLCELAGNFDHPVLGKSIKQLLKSCEDTLEANKLDSF